MKEIIISIVAIAVAVAGGIYGFKKYDDGQKIAAFEKKVSDIAKYDSRIDSYELDGDIITGELSLQNGFGAWAKKDFEALIGYGSESKYGVVALFMNEGKPDEYIHETRQEALEARRLMKEYKAMPKAIADLKSVGYGEDSPQVKGLRDFQRRIEKQMPELKRKMRIRPE